jgi:hypothetical protein
MATNPPRAEAVILAGGPSPLIEVDSWKLIYAAEVAATSGPTKPTQAAGARKENSRPIVTR